MLVCSTVRLLVTVNLVNCPTEFPEIWNFGFYFRIFDEIFEVILVLLAFSICLPFKAKNMKCCSVRWSSVLLLCIYATVVCASPRIPRTNLGIRTKDARKSYNSNSALRKVGGGNTRGGASAVAAPLAAKTMSANQYKFLK